MTEQPHERDKRKAADHEDEDAGERINRVMDEALPDKLPQRDIEDQGEEGRLPR